MMSIFPIHERFLTFQGEGIHMGRPAFFVRTFGCPVHCPWCDSAGTWHPDWVPKEVAKMSVEEIVTEAETSNAPFVVITGGEPTIFDLHPLVEGLHKIGLGVHLETSGGFPIKGLFDWITLSPKKWKPPLTDNVCVADEFKFIIETPEDIVFYHQMLLDKGLPPTQESAPIWLHPEWSCHENPEVLDAISKAVGNGADLFRAGWQLHKCYKVDFLDHRARIPVPLGGDVKRGF